MRLIFEKRLDRSRTAEFFTPIVSLILALLAGAVLLVVAGANPWETYKAMAIGAFGSRYSLSETLVKAIPLMLTGLGVSVAFRMLFWNIGAEGQLAMGGFAASGVALFFPELLPGLPVWTLLPLMFLAGFLAGAVWGLVPAVLKAFLNVNEIITTLMLNYVAILWVEYLFYGPWKDPHGYGFPGTAQFPEAAWLPRLSGRVHLGLMFAILAALFLWLIMTRTQWGYEIRVIGENPRAARYAGISLARNILLVMLLSGGLAGLAGFGEVAGISHRLQKGLTVGYGYTAIIVAWLAKLNPWGVLLVALLLAGLLVGGDQIQITMGLPAAVALVLQGAILFFMLGSDVFARYRVRIVRYTRAPTVAAPELFSSVQHASESVSQEISEAANQRALAPPVRSGAGTDVGEQTTSNEQPATSNE
ncbi:MAG TPA: ABC transporter permease [Anaerolineae bacterium]|nr:ABC transporter permease [Anaerolineae bacterium]